MTKIDALRRFLLPCFFPTATPSAAIISTTTKKRLSTSLRDDDLTQDHPSSSSSDTTPKTSPTGRHHHHFAPPRSSKSMVIGTIFGRRRRGHVWFCIQHDRLSPKPSLLLELSIPMHALVNEMQCGLVRIALESRQNDAAVPLRAVTAWTMYCNGRKVGFAARRRSTAQTRHMLRTMQSVTVGAGVIPAPTAAGDEEEEEEEEKLLYMRANYECVVGNGDSESYHLISPDERNGQELSVFLIRTR